MNWSHFLNWPPQLLYIQLSNALVFCLTPIFQSTVVSITHSAVSVNKQVSSWRQRCWCTFSDQPSLSPHTGLLNVKTVDGRCTRSVCCIMMSSGHRGKPHVPWTDERPCVSSDHCFWLSIWHLHFPSASFATSVWRSPARRGKRTSSLPKVSLRLCWIIVAIRLDPPL
jgi:hypothetical protein